MELPAFAEEGVCKSAGENRESDERKQTCRDGVFEDAGEAVAQKINHVDDWIEGGGLLEQWGETGDRVKHAAEEDQGHEDKIHEEGYPVEVVSPDSDNYSDKTEERGD